jgi:hypothetical protein
MDANENKMVLDLFKDLEFKVPPQPEIEQPAVHDPLPVQQTDERVALVNGNKVLEEHVLRRIDEIALLPDVDQRWLSVGRTHIEQAFMAINRSIFRPGRLELGD